MKLVNKRLVVLLVCGVLFTISVNTIVLADEKIGNLVFSAMQKIQENHESFLQDVKKVRATRQKAVAERQALRKKYENARDGSLDRQEAHAHFSCAHAKVYQLLYDETRLTHNIAKKQLTVLNRLNDSIDSGETALTSEETTSVIEASKPLLENGKSLLSSLGEYRDKIKDPVVNSKLNGVVATAKVLSQYIDHLEKGRVNRYASKTAMKQKVNELIDQLNALYTQTDVFMAMIQDKTTVMKMINELAAAELVTFALLDGGKVVTHLSTDVMDPMMRTFYESDEYLDALAEDVLRGDGEGLGQARSISQSWANPTF